MTKVEQLVMGAFWEAADQAFQREEYPRHTKAETEERFALWLATIIRTRGLESFGSAQKEASLNVRTNHVKHTANSSAETLEGIASMLERETSTMRTFVSRFRSDATRLRELAKDL